MLQGRRHGMCFARHVPTCSCAAVAVVHAVLTGASAEPSSWLKAKGSFTALKPSARMRVTCVPKSAVMLLDPCTTGLTITISEHMLVA